MKAEDIQKLLEQQQNKFNQQQLELQERQNQQLMVQQEQIAELLKKLGNTPNIDSATSLQQEESALYGLPDSAIELKQNCIRLVENKSKKKEDCKFKELLEDCRAFLSTKKEVKLLSEPKQVSKIELGSPPEINIIQEPILQKSNIEIENKNRYYPPAKRPYCKHCKKEGHWIENCYFADKSNDGPYCVLLDIDDNEVLQKHNWIVQKLKINGTSINMIVDTAAQISIISKETWSQLGEPKLEEVSYNGIAMGQSKFKIEGKFVAKIDCNDKEELLDCHVVEGKLNVIGLPWLQKLKLLKNIVKVPEFEKKRKKIVWNKQKPLPKPIVKQKLWKGKNVIVKNKNNRTNKIEWLKGEIVGKIGQLFRVQVHCLKSVILRKIEDIKEDYQQPRIESKKCYAVKRSDARMYDDGATPKKKTKIWSEDPDDKMESCSEGSIKSEGSEDNMKSCSDGSINSEGSNISEGSMANKIYKMFF
uniref:Uncharacterized protein n=1 Tax=Meloidogyne enterolobii TaxID=390850 RepID=A0A6V7WQ50_MELEN|nr:unnamed protein product [Meloidogyne enterolobii]